MDAGRIDTDVIVVGGGPAGGAAAIVCAEQRLRVHLFEREAFARERVGETFHPGIEPVLAQLGVAGELSKVVGARHEGVWVDWGGARRFEAYGTDAAGPWRGFQVSRVAFDRMLLARAGALGAKVMQPCGVHTLRGGEGGSFAVETDGGPISTRVIIDASGPARWLGRGLGVGQFQRSPRLVARYGYAAGRCPARDKAPLLVGDGAGWLWTALVRPDVYQWTRVAVRGRGPGADWIPEELRGLTPLGRSRGADVTWRIAGDVARPGWFMAGDAAASLDPTSSHGVLKALLSGMAAGRLAAAVLRGRIAGADACAVYRDWLEGWFAHDAGQLAHHYQRLGIAEFGAMRAG